MIKVAFQFSVEGMAFQKWFRDSSLSILGEILELYLIQYTKIHSECIQVLNIKIKTIKLLEINNNFIKMQR